MYVMHAKYDLHDTAGRSSAVMGGVYTHSSQHQLLRTAAAGYCACDILAHHEKQFLLLLVPIGWRVVTFASSQTWSTVYRSGVRLDVRQPSARLRRHSLGTGQTSISCVRGVVPYGILDFIFSFFSVLFSPGQQPNNASLAMINRVPTPHSNFKNINIQYTDGEQRYSSHSIRSTIKYYRYISCEVTLHTGSPSLEGASQDSQPLSFREMINIIRSTHPFSNFRLYYSSLVVYVCLSSLYMHGDFSSYKRGAVLLFSWDIIYLVRVCCTYVSYLTRTGKNGDIRAYSSTSRIRKTRVISYSYAWYVVAHAMYIRTRRMVRC